MQNMARIERERKRRQMELLEAAEELFAVKNFHETTIQEISEKSEFSVGSIYHMFSNKDEIYRAILLMRFREYASALNENIQRAEDPLEKVKQFIKTKIEYFERHRSFLKLVLNTTFGSRMDVQIGLTKEFITRYQEHLNLLAGIFQEGIEKNLFSGNDPIGMACAIEGISNSFLSYWIRNEKRSGPAPKAESIEKIFLDGILNSNRKK